MSETTKRLSVGHDRLHTAPLKFGGMDVVFDPALPENEVRLVDHAGKVLARATLPTPPAEQEIGK